jgi:hypothetical protein
MRHLTDEEREEYRERLMALCKATGRNLWKEATWKEPDVLCPTCGQLKDKNEYCSNSFHLSERG